MAGDLGFDTSWTITQKVCDVCKQKLVKFIIRYYSLGNPAKVISRDEAKLILDNNLKLVIVYQDSNNQADCFSEEKGRNAAEAAANCAEAIGQPSESAIYFAVDYDCGPVALKNNVIPYFNAVKKYFADQNLGYSVGVYGSGFICRSLKEQLDLSYTWLAYASWLESDTYTDYSIKQLSVNKDFAEIKVDYDRCNSKRDYGAFTSLV